MVRDVLSIFKYHDRMMVECLRHLDWLADLLTAIQS